MESFSFTQCACVLFDRAPALHELQRALDAWPIAGDPNQGSGDDAWAVCGPGFIVELRGGGFAVVDLVDRPWPDDAGSGSASSAVASAWRAGAFGPASSPRALARAIDQAWSWPDGAATGADHRAFVRLRTGVVAADAAAPEESAEGGAAEAGPGQARPQRSDPLYELTSLTEIARPLLKLEGALGLFVPGGEALRSREQVVAALDRKVGVGPPPIELWSNLRSVALPADGGAQWLLLDVVGMGQFGLPDVEALFAEGQERPEAVEAMLRSACLRLMAGGPIPSGFTSEDGAGRRWRATAARAVVAPPRPVVRWLPEASARPTEAMLASVVAAAEVTAGTDSG